jgi:hypothetical protein
VFTMVLALIFDSTPGFVISVLLAGAGLVVVAVIITLGWTEYFTPEF